MHRRLELLLPGFTHVAINYDHSWKGSVDTGLFYVVSKCSRNAGNAPFNLRVA